MSALVRSYLIDIGNNVNFSKPMEVIAKKVRGDEAIFTLKINEEKCINLKISAMSFLEVHDPEPEAPDMPDNGEIVDRALALAMQPGFATLDLHDVLAFFVEMEVFDIPRLIELTNDLGPFEAEPVRSCRVCGCTDDDCSRCIEATGEPCGWVEDDLCSRCQDEGFKEMIKNEKP